MKDPINLGLGEQAISRNPDDILVAYGLGSCLGISMIDPLARISGLLHAVLPEKSNGVLGCADPSVSYKYVDSGIECLLNALIKQGASKSRLIVRMVGGANMLISPGLSNTFDIGTRNIEKARMMFQRLDMSLAAEEVGGHTGRTMRVYVADCRVTVKLIGQKEHEI